MIFKSWFIRDVYKTYSQEITNRELAQIIDNTRQMSADLFGAAMAFHIQTHDDVPPDTEKILEAVNAIALDNQILMNIEPTIH